jgi:hypothetical protein
LSGRFDASGIATMLLPAEAVANGSLPYIACYVSSPSRETWISVAQIPLSSSDTYCALTGIGRSLPGVTIVNGVEGDFYYLIAVW